MAGLANAYGVGGGSGGGLAGAYASGSGGGSGSAPKKKKQAKGVGGFFDNLGGDIKDLVGIPAGLAAIGKAAYHDATNGWGRPHTDYQLDDIGGAVWKEYQHTYAPLFKGEYKTFGKRLYAHPLSPILDAATAVTGGGALAGKIAAKTARVTGSPRALRYAGLQPVDTITPSTVRGVTGPAGNFAAATHKIIDPLTEQVLAELPVVRNPVIRARKAMMEKAYTKLPSTGPAALTYMHPSRRGPRLAEAQTRRSARRDASNLDRSYLAAYNKLDQDEKDALVYIAQGFNTAERATALRTQRLQRAAEKTSTPAPTRKGGNREHAKSGADVADLEKDAKVIERVLPLIESPTPALTEALRAQHAVDSVTQATFIRNLIRDGKTPEEAEDLIRARAQMPLRAVGIEPGEGEIPMILTHAVDRSTAGNNLERGMAVRTLDEERETTGENFLNARYERDASTILSTHRLMFAKEQTHMRMERALSKAIPYDRAKHAQLVRDGKLRWIKKDDPMVKDMGYVDNTLDRIEASSKQDFSDAEMESLRDTFGAMHDLIMQEGSPGLVLPKAHYDELVGQFSGAKGILEKITDGLGVLIKPWRHIVLSLKGSFYVNNFIGNMFLGLVAYGPRYILDVGKESLPAAMRNAGDTPVLPGALPGGISKRIDDEVSDMKRTTGASVVSESKAARWDVISRLGEKVSAKGALLTEDNFRRAGFRANLRTLERNLEKSMPGTTRHERIEAIFNDKAAVDQLAEQTYGDLLDYSKLTPLERELLLPIFPFWNFTRSMTGRTIRLALDEPWKLRVLLYFGQSGIEANQDALPEGLDLPEYLKGMIMLDKTGDTQRVMSSYGMNPFTAPADMASQLFGMFGKGEGSQNPLVAMSPFAKVPLEALIGKDLFTGQDIIAPDGSAPEGTLGRMAVQARKNIPQLAMLDRYRYPSKYPAIERDASDTAMQYAGLPVGTLRPDNIAAVNSISAYYDAQEKAAQDSRKKAIGERARY